MKKIYTKLLMILSIILILTTLTGCPAEDPSIYQYEYTGSKATSNHISSVNTDFKTNTSNKINASFIPKENITDLEITFYFFDSNGKTVAKKAQKIGDVEKDKEYKTVIDFSDISSNERYSIRLIDWNVTNGTIKK